MLGKSSTLATLTDVYEITAALRWRGLRSETKTMADARRVIGLLEARGVRTMDAVTSYHIADLVEHFTRSGCKPATIQRTLAPLYTMSGVAVAHTPPLASRPLPRHGVRKRVTEKWWLTPDARDSLLPWLRERGDALLADYVEWTYCTGFRVEESLRLHDRHLVGLDTARPNVVVPGTKTARAQTTLPLGDGAAEVARRRLNVSPDGRVFPIAYCSLWEKWQEARVFLGVEGVATSTLKALRRSFAWHVGGKMATERMQRYLRHTNITTTIGYMQVVGASDMEGIRGCL